MPDINKTADLVERLRDGIVVAPSLTGGGSHIDIAATEAMLSEAAAEISRLRDALKAETEECAAIADYGVKWEPALPERTLFFVDETSSRIAAAIRARTALEANHG